MNKLLTLQEFCSMKKNKRVCEENIIDTMQCTVVTCLDIKFMILFIYTPANFSESNAQDFFLQSVRISEDDLTISEDFQKLPRTFPKNSWQSFMTHLGLTKKKDPSWRIWDWLEKDPSPEFYSAFKMDLHHGLFSVSNWVKFTFFCGKWVILKLTSSHFVSQAWEMVHRHDLAWDPSFWLAGVRLTLWKLVGIYLYIVTLTMSRRLDLMSAWCPELYRVWGNHLLLGLEYGIKNLALNPRLVTEPMLHSCYVTKPVIEK